MIIFQKKQSLSIEKLSFASRSFVSVDTHQVKKNIPVLIYHYLILKGEKKESKEEKDENYVRRERYYGSYQRTIALTETADAEGVKATFNKGVLFIEIPKKEEAVKKSRKVEISSAA